MRIALVVPHLYPEFGGHEYYLARELAKLGQQVKVFTSDLKPTRYFKRPERVPTEPKSFDEPFQMQRIYSPTEIHGVPVFNPSPALRNYLPDIIHTQEYFQLCSQVAFSAARKLNSPFIFTQHKYDYPKGAWKILWKILDHTAGRNLRNQASQITAISSAAKDFLVSIGASRHQITVIPLGVDTQEFNPTVNGTLFRQKLQILDKTVILFIGRLTPTKGVQDLLRAFSRVHKNFTDTCLIIRGDGEQKQHLQELSKQLQIKESVIFLDAIQRSKLPQLYAACDIFVLPSLKEPFGIVLLEAMATSKPLIGSKVGGIPDIIRDNVNGFLFEAGNVNELTSRLSELVIDSKLRTKMGKMGREISLNIFNYKTIAKKTLEIYSQCME